MCSKRIRKQIIKEQERKKKIRSYKNLFHDTMYPTRRLMGRPASFKYEVGPSEAIERIVY
jgi:hypothetical protein